MRVYTIGHSTRSLEDFRALLAEHEVRTLVDVRSLPGSRRYPHFDKESLAETLPPEMRYVHVPELGGRRRTPRGVVSPNGAWRHASFRAYADYMAGAEFADGLSQLLGLAEESRTAIMCSESVPWRCHRSLISDALIACGVEVVDVIGPGQTRAARMHDFALVDCGHVTYPKEAAAA